MFVLSKLRLIVGTAAAVAMLGAGYSFGARKVDALEEQLAKLRQEFDEATARLKRSQEEIAKVLKDKELEYDRQAKELKSGADQREKALSTALSGANARIESLKAQVSAVDARRARLVKERDAAVSAADRKKAEERIEAADREKMALVGKVDANQCLALAVPEEVIGEMVARK